MRSFEWIVLLPNFVNYFFLFDSFSPLIWTHHVATSPLSTPNYIIQHEIQSNSVESWRLCWICETRRNILVRCNAVRRTDTTRGGLADCDSVPLVASCLLLNHQTSLPLPLLRLHHPPPPPQHWRFNCNVGPTICRTVPNEWAKFLLWNFPREINLLYLLFLSEFRLSSYTVYLNFK
jgi:hypothetical protein